MANREDTYEQGLAAKPYSWGGSLYAEITESFKDSGRDEGDDESDVEPITRQVKVCFQADVGKIDNGEEPD